MLVFLLSTNLNAFNLGDIDYPYGIVTCTSPSGQHLWAVVVTDLSDAASNVGNCYQFGNIPNLITFP